MPKPPQSNTTRLIILAAFIFAVAYSLLYLLHDSVGMHRWQESGYLESRMAHVTDSTSVFRKVIRSDFEAPPIPSAGDTVLEVGGKPMTMEHHVQFGPSVKYDIRPLPALQQLSVKFVHEGDTLQTAFAMNPPSTKLKWFLILVDILRHLIALSMLAVGGYGIYSRGESTVVQIFALYCLARAGEAIGSYFIPLSYGLFPHAIAYPLESWIPNLLDAGLVSFWLHLQFIFPRPLAWVERHKAIVYILCYYPTIHYLAVFFARSFPALREWIPPSLSDAPLEIISWIYLIAGVAILIFRYNTTDDRVERRQLRLFIGGSAVGLIAAAILSILYAYWFDWYDSTPYVDLIGSAIVYLATLLGPISFVYAFRRYRLMEIEGRLKRGTRLALVTGVFLASLAGIVIVTSRFLLEVTGVDSLTVTLALGFGLSLGVIPAQRRINAFVEKKLYPERARLRAMLINFLHSGATPVDQKSFWNSFSELLTRGLKVDKSICIRMDQTPLPLDGGGATADYLAEAKRALLVDEAESIDDVLSSDPVFAAWLKENHIGILLPLVLRDRLSAIIAIGFRTDDEDYDSEELQILNSFAPQIAIAAENLRLIEENFDKKRMEAELASARNTQQGLLPKGIPECRGLELGAVCRFCTEVAGDYYDIVPLNDGKTCLAIGDVSGKGAAASLLMASLQSSLNTAIPFGIPLSEIVARINNVVCRNTSPEQFITFFIAVFDPVTKVISYVNAGHDAPILTRLNGHQEMLDVGGVILGCLPDLPYSVGTLQLQCGDALLLYTDGAREAWNSGEEEYGMERLMRFSREHRELGAGEQVERLESDVVSFHGGSRFDDDFTLVMVKVL